MALSEGAAYLIHTLFLVDGVLKLGEPEYWEDDGDEGDFCYIWRGDMISDDECGAYHESLVTVSLKDDEPFISIDKTDVDRYVSRHRTFPDLRERIQQLVGLLIWNKIAHEIVFPPPYKPSKSSNSALLDILNRERPRDQKHVVNRGEPFTAPVTFQNVQWAVTGYGIECTDGKYPIEASSLTRDWPHYSLHEHMGEKGWVNQAQFYDAFRVAIQHFNPEHDRDLLSLIEQRARDSWHSSQYEEWLSRSI